MKPSIPKFACNFYIQAVLLVFSTFSSCARSQTSSAAFANCPCSDPNWCEPVKVTYEKEVFAFSIRNDESHWKLFDWSRLTTVVLFGYLNESLMCLAHSHNVRVVLLGGVDEKTFVDPTARQKWILQQLMVVKSNFLDGLNFDYEDVILSNQTEVRDAYTALVKETNSHFKRELPFSQISVDVAWKPNTDLRYYDYPGLAEASDFLFVMAYDEQSQIFGECIAGPNSAWRAAVEGLTAYLEGYNGTVKPSSLVLGIPWYGYIYLCIKMDGDKCYIEKVPFRGVNCSDAAGKQYDYGFIHTLIKTMPDHYKWNASSATPFLTYLNEGKNQSYQVQFDDPRSLKFKYDLAAKMDIRGVGMWNIDSLDYSDTEDGREIRAAMFGALPPRVTVPHDTVASSASSKGAECPCSNPQWCEPIKDAGRKEVFAFSTHNDENNWLLYDWTKITTVSMVDYINTTLMCLAHSHNARITYIARVDEKTFVSPTLRKQWIQQQLQITKENFLDGINFDFEGSVGIGQKNISEAYADLVNETNIIFKNEMPYCQISVDVIDDAFSTYRAYNYRRLYEAADFLFIMAYDESGFDVVGPNSALGTANYAINTYVQDHIGVDKLVLGVPWYGYVYECTRLEGDHCYFTKGNKVATPGYATIYYLRQTVPDAYKWNFSSNTPYFSYTDSSSNKSYQVQFDDPYSLKLKYDLASEKGLKGVGMWNIDCLDFSNSETGQDMRDSMFGVLPHRDTASSSRFKSGTLQSLSEYEVAVINADDILEHDDVDVPVAAAASAAAAIDVSDSDLRATAACPCSDPKLCEPIKDTTRKEVYAFSIKNDENQWLKYDWSKITTVCMYNYVNVSLMCLAHSHGARAVVLGVVREITIITPGLRKAWIEEQLGIVKSNFLDGLNFDVELTIHPDQKDLINAYTALVTETYQAFKKELPYSQISVDVIHDAFSKDCAYDYPGLAAASDFLFIMAYDEYGYGQVGPNSDYIITNYSIDSYIKDGISADKLVLGLPWYGYIYNCSTLVGDKCSLNKSIDPSIRQATQRLYVDIYTLLQTMPEKYRWNTTSLSPYFSYTDPFHNKSYQVQYDNPESLKYRYDLAAIKGVRGVGMWTIDFLDYSDTAKGEAMRKSMFDPLPSRPVV